MPASGKRTRRTLARKRGSSSRALLTVFAFSTLLAVSIEFAGAALPTTLAELNDWYSEPPAGQNGAALVLQGANLLKVSPTDRTSNIPWIGSAKAQPLDKPQPPALSKAIADFLRVNQAAFFYLRRAADQDLSRYPVDFTKGLDIDMLHLKKAQEASRYLAVLALYEASRSQSSKAAEPLLANFGLAKSLEAEPCLISQRVRGLIVIRAFEALEQTLNRVSLTSDSLSKLQNLLQKAERQELDGLGLFRGIVGDRLSMGTLFDLPPDKAEGILDDIFKQMRLQENLSVTAIHYSGTADKDFTEAFYGRVLDLCKKAHSARSHLIIEECLRQQAIAKEKGLVIGYLNSFRIAHAVTAEVQTLACLRLAGIAVALERYRVAAGRYPETLSQLQLPSGDADTPAPDTTQELDYKKSSKGYVISCVSSELPKGSSGLSFRIVTAGSVGGVRP